MLERSFSLYLLDFDEANSTDANQMNRVFSKAKVSVSHWVVFCVLGITCSLEETAAQATDNRRLGLESIAQDTMWRRNESVFQTFHIGRSKMPGGKDDLFVYWPEARRIFRFPFTETDSDYWLHPALMMDFVLDLETDIVESEEDIDGSSYLTDVATARIYIESALDGEKIVIVIPVASRPPPD